MREGVNMIPSTEEMAHFDDLQNRASGLEDPGRVAYESVHEAYVIFSASQNRFKLQGASFIVDALEQVRYDHNMGKMQPPLPEEVAELLNPAIEAMRKPNGKIRNGVAYQVGGRLIKAIMEHGYRSDGVGERG